MTLTIEDRYCPICGHDGPERYCPSEGTATVLRRRPSPGSLDYQAGHVVDGRYRITGRLGSGGFGAVFSAIHTGTGQDVALKVLHVDLSSDNAPIVRRFWQEAQITSRLRHANTVRVFDVGQTEEGAFYLTMEHLHGESLADVLESRARQGQMLTEQEAVEIAIQVCRSLQEAHRAGLVHRDLKPGNVMLCEVEDEPEPLVKVLDFGIARTADSSLTGAGTAIGTPAYMSPEQCRGQDIDARSDLYSLGILLFRCVAGRVPFVDENPLSVMFQHAESPVPDPRTLAPIPLSDGFVTCLLRALAKRAGDRFADAREMREALEALCVNEDAQTQALLPALPVDFDAATAQGSALPLAVDAPAPEPTRRRRVALLAGGVALAAAAALMVSTLDGPPKAHEPLARAPAPVAVPIAASLPAAKVERATLAPAVVASVAMAAPATPTAVEVALPAARKQAAAPAAVLARDPRGRPVREAIERQAAPEPRRPAEPEVASPPPTLPPPTLPAPKPKLLETPKLLEKPKPPEKPTALD